MRPVGARLPLRRRPVATLPLVRRRPAAADRLLDDCSCLAITGYSRNCAGRGSTSHGERGNRLRGVKPARAAAAPAAGKAPRRSGSVFGAASSGGFSRPHTSDAKRRFGSRGGAGPAVRRLEYAPRRAAVSLRVTASGRAIEANQVVRRRAWEECQTAWSRGCPTGCARSLPTEPVCA